MLQHPGYYFFMAGMCAVERRDRFRALKRQYEEYQLDSTSEQPAPLPTSLAHESKVDHADLIIEVSDAKLRQHVCRAIDAVSLPQMLTKAYEFFKAHKNKNMTLFVASQIALAHLESGNHEMALK